MLTQSIRNNSIVLGIFALATALLLSATHLGTEERIEQSQRAAAQKALFEVVPRDRHNNDMLSDILPVPPHYRTTLGLDEGGEIHVARRDGEPVAVIVPAVAPDGYSGDISLIVGINMDGSIAGIRVLAHQETPGLGDKVDLKRSNWILSFNGKSLGNPPADRWKVKKDQGDFDQFTGATITPRAVVHKVLQTLRYFEEDRERLLKELKPTKSRPQEVSNDG